MKAGSLGCGTRRLLRSGCGSDTDLGKLDERLREDAQIFFRVLQHAGLKPTVTSAVRPPSVQRCLKERADTGVSKLPALAPGKSLHQQGLAFDLVVTGGAALQARVGALWEAVFGGEWGGRAGDPVHFQRKRLTPGKPSSVDVLPPDTFARARRGDEWARADVTWYANNVTPVELSGPIGSGGFTKAVLQALGRL